MSRFKQIIEFGKEVGQEISDDEVPGMAASVAYFAILSLPPLLAVTAVIAGTVFSPEEVQTLLTGEMGDVLGEDGADQLATMLERARDVGSGGIGTQLLGAGALLLGATGAFVHLQKSLNRAWGLEPDPERSGIKVLLVKRLMSFGMVLMIAFLLAISMVLSAVLSALSAELSQLMGGAGWALMQAADIILPLIVFTLLFAAMFKVLPDGEITWRVVWVGAFFTAALLVIGKFLLSLYFGMANVGEAFGAAGSLVIVLVWIYYSVLLLLVGAEITQVWARRQATEIKPDDGAVKVVRERRLLRSEGDNDGNVHHPYVSERAPQERAGIEPEPHD